MDDVKSLHDLIWILPTGVASIAVLYIRSLAQSVMKLNEHMAVWATKTAHHQETLSDHEQRLRKVEQI